MAPYLFRQDLRGLSFPLPVHAHTSLAISLLLIDAVGERKEKLPGPPLPLNVQEKVFSHTFSPEMKV